MGEGLKPSGIGGQAVMEGVMMRNRSKYAVAVRKTDGQLILNVKEYHSVSEKYKFLGWPFIRGAVNLIESMVVGMKTLMYSANFADVEDEPKKSKNDAANEASSDGEGASTKEAKEPNKDNGPLMTPGMIALTVILALGMTIVLFMFLPLAITSLVERLTGFQAAWFSSLVEGVLRILIFVGYVALISLTPDIKRVFRYHGAEHKTINCIEHGLPLTVENARKSSKEHKRCGTSFMIIVMVISILIFSLVNLIPMYTGTSRILRFLVRFGVRLLLLPLVAGVSYEFLKLAGRSESRLVDILSRPGMWMQALTTKEPDDSMLETAIASVEAVFDWKLFLDGEKAENCGTELGVGEFLAEEDGTYTATVSGYDNGKSGEDEK